MISQLLFRLYAIKSSLIRKIIRIFVLRLEGGEFYSRTIRKIYKIYHDIEIGLYSYRGCFRLENIPSGTKIGRYGSFANFIIFPRNHPHNHLSTHPFFYNPALGFIKKEIVPPNKLHIGHDVWIGENAFIMPSVSEIGNGAVIGAGTVVTKNVPPYAIVVGNPGKIIKYRFSQDVIEKIEEMQWWEKNIDELLPELSKFSRSWVETDTFGGK